MKRSKPKQIVTIDGVDYKKFVRGGYKKGFGYFSFRVSHKGEPNFPVYLKDEEDWRKGFYGSSR